MNLNWLKIIAGQAPLPSDMLERNRLVEFADAQHVLGQMHISWHEAATGKLRDLLENAKLRSDFDHRMLQHEIERLERALMGSGIRPVLLKGAAYVATGIRAGKGRRVSDIDILVSENELLETEKLLREAGWAFDDTVDNAYDIAYYRDHMHELPPLRHQLRRTIIDVHHRIVPPTARVQVDTEMLVAASAPLEGTMLRTFTPVDMFIHAAVHNFADGPFDTPARSLLELHYLLAELSVEDRSELPQRAAVVGAHMPVATAIWALAELFGDETAAGMYDASVQRVAASALVRGAIADKLDDIDRAHRAKLILFLRSHYLRMPLIMLAGHLLRKAVRRLTTLPTTVFRRAT